MFVLVRALFDVVDEDDDEGNISTTVHGKVWGVLTNLRLAGKSNMRNNVLEKAMLNDRLGLLFGLTSRDTWHHIWNLPAGATF